MSVELNTLLTAQREIHGRITRSVDNLKKLGSANINLGAIDTRLRLLDSLWEKFEAQHEMVRSAFKDKYSESEYVRSNLFELAEDAYVQQRGALLGYADKFRPASTSSAPSSERDQKGDIAPRTTLPRIKLPQFSGAYKDWPTFRDLFLSVVGENKSVSNIERFHYLRACLQGQAENLISPLALTGENYDRAWAILSKHFENKRELMRTNFSAFAAVAKMKSDTADELTRIYNAVTTVVNGQESLGRPIESHGMDLLNFCIIELFDPRTRLEWESATCDSSDPPDHEKLRDFISKRVLTLNAARPRTSAKASQETSRPAKSHFAKHATEPQCALCKGKHSLMSCETFRAKPAIERKKVIDANRRCFNCLGNHLVAKCVSSRNCITCNGRHHTMLHDAYTSQAEKTSEVNALSAVRVTNDRRAILLATARVLVADRHGNPHAVRVLIDQGSEVSIVSESLVQRLRLPRSHSDVSIFGIGGAPSGSTRGKVTLTMTSPVTGVGLTVVALILPRLSAYGGAQAKRTAVWSHVQGLQLADPQYLATDPVDLLLGAEVCSTILEEGLRKGKPRTPIAQKTSLGWILSGGCSTTSPSGHRSVFQATVDVELDELVRRFWEQEAEPSVHAAMSPDDLKCEEHFVRTHSRTENGRYVVRLPFRTPPTTLAGTRIPAERILTSMERKCHQDTQFGVLYQDFMREYETLGHMEPAVDGTLAETGSRCYLPHHGVMKGSDATAKLRVVFNGSQKTKAGESLNSHLLVGTNLLPPLADVLLRWRWHKYVLVTDVEKMYRQIIVHQEDRDYQRILWRHSTTDAVREYRLNTVTYGLACAPFLAIRTLRQLADDEESRFPHGAAALRRDCYVDDVVTGAHSLVDAAELQEQLRKLCEAGGFPLRKWAANNAHILAGIPFEHQLRTTPRLWEEEAHATLGLRWHPREDSFAFAIQPRKISAYTKRRVLAETARLFDPLGWLSPVIIRAKILIQTAWLQRIEWDAPLPPADARKWERLLSELPVLDRIRVDRWLGSGNALSNFEIHGFADASERGYAAAVYLRVTTDDATRVHLLVAKSKVAPVKQVSLPRLELCAATLLATLTHHVRSCMNLSTALVYLWSDSQVTLHWIRGHPSRWKTYVANRVSRIQVLLPEARWRHVPGRHNPADCASRGLAPSDLVSHSSWWTGPDWLRDGETSWPRDVHEIQDHELPETRALAGVSVHKFEMEHDLLTRFSSLHHLLRVTAWCWRWRRHATRADQRDPEEAVTLAPSELDESLHLWLRMVQRMHYPDELAAIAAHRSISRRSQLASLDPSIDDKGVLRVGGRLKHATLSHDEMHPMILPPASWLARLIIESCHRRTLHGGVQLTLGLLRLRFWMPRGRTMVKQVIHRCVACIRWRAATPRPAMGHLPQGRVTPSRPFLHSGVDYAGPIRLRTSKGRGHQSTKAFIAIFVCLCSRAVHIEVVSDYSSDAFLAALRRFVSRRGLCTDIYSDCGTTFVGADRALREFFRATTSVGRHIARTAATDGIKWHFNPPAAPHFGGLWEAAVKSTKHHLRRVIGEATLTFEEFSTLLAQVEACLNSRPLQALSDDPSDISALTPGHFLIGAPLLAVPAPSLLEKGVTSLTRWQLIQRMRDHFWSRWMREYIHTLLPRPKWFKSGENPEVGDLCLVRNELTPPSRWPLARITKIHPGEDGVVRVVTVRTATSELTRPLVKIVLLPRASVAQIAHGKPRE